MNYKTCHIYQTSLSSIVALLLFAWFPGSVYCIEEKDNYEGGDKSSPGYINIFIENGSNLNWDITDNGIVSIYLAYDHWHFITEGQAGSEITMVFHNFNEIYNRKHIPFDTWIMDCISSADGKTWQHVPVEWVEGNRMRVELKLASDSLYVTRVEPYRLSDLWKGLQGVFQGSTLMAWI